MADRSVIVRLGADIKNYQTGMRNATQATVSFEKEVEAVAARRREAFDTLASTMGKVGLGAAALGTIAVRAFANFDEAMSAVKATGKDAASSITELRDLAIDMGAKTKFSATESAGAIEAMAKAGVSAKDILGGGLSGALDLAAAGGLEVGEAAEIAATAMNQFGLAGADVPHIADVLAAAAGKAMGEVSDMGQAFKYVGPVAKQMGISLEETGGTIAYLAQQGILGDQAGTSLRGMLSSLTSPSKIAAKTMKELGINVYDAQGRFVGFDGVAGQLQESLRNLSNAQRDEALGRIFGNEQITTARLLYEGGAKSIQQWTKAVDDQGFAADTAATKMDNLKGDFEELTGALESAFITTAAGTDGPLRDLTQLLTGLTDAYNGLPQPMKDATMGAIGLTAVVGGGVWATSKAVASYEKMQATFGALGGSYEKTTKKAAAARAGALGVGLALGSLSDDIGRFDERAGIATDALSGMAVGFAVGGPWGSAIGGAIGLVKGFGDAHADAEAEIRSLIGTYDQLTGKMTDAARAKAVEDLNKPLQEGLLGTKFGQVDMTALEAARTLGIDLRTLTDAALGSGRALQTVNDRIGDIRNRTGPEYAAEAERLGVDIEDLADAYAYLGEYVERNSDKWREAGARARDAAIATSGQIETTRQFAQALEGIPTGVETELRLLGYEPSSIQLDDIIRRYNLTPEQIQTVLTALDRATPLIDAVDDKRRGLDGATATPTIDVNDRASGTIDWIRSSLNGIDTYKRITIETHRINTGNNKGGSGRQTFADGGMWKAFADGGFDEYGRPVQRVPQLRNASQGMVAWGEPETGWEAYVSGKPSMKGRNRAILSEAASRLGGSVEWFADGGFTEALSARELTSLRIRVRDLRRSLKETEKYGKGGKKKRLALRGLDRLEARQELAEAEAELREQYSIRRTMKRQRIGAGAYNSRMQAAADAKEGRQSTAESFANGLDSDAFRSPASLDRALTNLVRDSAEYTSLLAQLARAGASPWLLDQIRSKAEPSRATNRTLRALLADKARLQRLNNLGGRVVSTANNYAALTSGRAFQTSQLYTGSAGFSQAQLDQITGAIQKAQVNVNAGLHVNGRQAGTLVQAGQRHIASNW